MMFSKFFETNGPTRRIETRKRSTWPKRTTKMLNNNTVEDSTKQTTIKSNIFNEITKSSKSDYNRNSNNPEFIKPESESQTPFIQIQTTQKQITKRPTTRKLIFQRRTTHRDITTMDSGTSGSTSKVTEKN
jgi:hypothetical protein